MKNTIKKLTSVLLAVLMLLTVFVVPISAERLFSDVPEDAWYAQAVEYAYGKGYMNGVGGGRFDPKGQVSRAMFVTVLARMAGAEVDDSTSIFTDVPAGRWYTGAITWAKQNGIVNGVSDTMFAPNDPITRQDLCTIYARFIEKMGYELPEGTEVTFSDARKIASYAKQAVALCARVGLVNGFKDGTFRPKGFSERSQVATILMRLDVLLEGGTIAPTPKPAQEFIGETDGDMSVAVSAPEGALPEGTNMSVSRVTDEAALAAIEAKIGSEVLAAADITFTKDGDELEPDAEVQVRISVDGLENLENPAVYHVKNDGSVEPVEGVELVYVTRGGSRALRFYAKDFSIYVVVEDPIVAPESRAKIIFHSETAETEDNPTGIVATYYVKNSDVLLGDGERQDGKSYIEDILADPNIDLVDPDPNADRPFLFRGWATTADYKTTDTPMTMAGVGEHLATNYVGSIYEGQEIHFYAMVFRYFNVRYYGHDKDTTTGQDVALGSDTVLRHLNETQSDYPVSMAFNPESNEKFMGWHVREDEDDYYISHVVSGLQPKDPEHPENDPVPFTSIDTETIIPNGSVLTIKGDIVLDVVSPQGHWLVFHENKKGATYNAPDFVLGDDVTVATYNKTDGMECNGYTFAGWYELKQGATLPVDVDEDGNELTTYYDLLNPDGSLKDEYKAYFEEAKFQFGSGLEPVRTHIYAAWKPVATAPYTVVIWTENYDSIGKDKKVYDLHASYTGSGTVGAAIPYTFNDNGSEDYVTLGGNAYRVTGFCLQRTAEGNLLDREGNVVAAADYPKITPEGDAVLNLYYNRILYNFRFYVYESSGTNSGYRYANNSRAWTGADTEWTAISTWNDTTAANLPQTTYDNQTPVRTTTTTPAPNAVGGGNYYGWYLTMSAYYGENITDKWPEYSELGTIGGSPYPVSFVMMPGAQLRPNPNAGVGRGTDTIKGLITTLDEGILGKTNDANGNYVVVRYNQYYNWIYHLYYECVPGETYTDTVTYNGKTYYLDQSYVSRSTNRNAGEQTPPQYPGFTSVKNGDNYYYSDYVQGSTTQGANGTPHELNFYYNRDVYPLNYIDALYLGGNQNTTLIGDHTGDSLNPNSTPEQIYYDQKVDTKGSYIPTPNSAEKGFIFAGWYADAACTQEYVWTRMPKGGITVYAKWIQIQYRVFLHPNAETQQTNPDLDWGNGSGKQAMNFRISYGKRVSTPTGTWTGGLKEFVGWFTDEACVNEPFDGDAFALNESNVTAAYDKTAPENYTDGQKEDGTTVDIDQWGNLPANTTGINKDIPRDWITKKLDIYAKWRTVLVGAAGIDVRYLADGFDATATGTTEVPVSGHFGANESTKVTYDAFKYLDTAKCVANPAPTPENSVDDEGVVTEYQFLYWVVQKWNGSAFEDVKDAKGNLVIVHPADTFEVLEEYANREQTGTDANNKPLYTYTVQLRAAYRPKDLASPTHIHWVANGGTFDAAENELGGGYKGDRYRDGTLATFYTREKNVYVQNGLAINEGVDIPEPPTREGYIFLGWGAMNLDEVKKTDTNNTVYYVDPYLDANDKELTVSSFVTGDAETARLFIYHDDEGYYVPRSVTPDGTDAEGDDADEYVPAKQVAADEKLPYNVMYAVWGSANFYVFHSATGKLEAIDYKAVRGLKEDGTFAEGSYDLAAAVTEGYLYGGYYKAYGGLATATVTEGETQKIVPITELIAASHEKNASVYKFKDSTVTTAWSTEGVSGKVTAVFDCNTEQNKSLTGFKAYDSTSLYIDANAKPKVRYWLRANACGYRDDEADNGRELVPEPGVVYYLKEVPNMYLPNKIVLTKSHGQNGKILDAYMVTAVDDTNYSAVMTAIRGLDIETNEVVLAKSFLLTSKDWVDASGKPIEFEFTPSTLNSAIPEGAGYVAVYHLGADFLEEKAGGTFRATPQWTTYDGVDVKQNPLIYTLSSDLLTLTYAAPAGTDKAQLAAAIAAAEDESLSAADYTAESWAGLQQALTAAKALNDDPDAEQDDVDDATDALNDALAALVPDKAGLQQAIDSAAEYNKDKDLYTSSTWAALEAALQDAQDVMDDDDATVAEIKAAIKALNDAIFALVPRADKTLLEAKIEEADALKRDDYISTGWSEFAAALTAAKAVDADLDAIQEDVDEALENLKAAMRNLTPKADKTDLQAKIDEADALNEADYTASSWAAMQEVLTSANAVNNDPDALQADVDAAKTALDNAIKALEKKLYVNTEINYLGSARWSDYSCRTVAYFYTTDGNFKSAYVEFPRIGDSYYYEGYIPSGFEYSTLILFRVNPEYDGTTDDWANINDNIWGESVHITISNPTQNAITQFWTNENNNGTDAGVLWGTYNP